MADSIAAFMIGMGPYSYYQASTGWFDKVRQKIGKLNNIFATPFQRRLCLRAMTWTRLGGPCRPVCFISY